MPDTIKLLNFWETFLDSLPEGEDSPADLYPIWHFGDQETMANELGGLVLEGRKTATCSLYWTIASGQEPMPRVGERSIITDWDGNPLCIIETTDVEIKAFNEVDEQFAYEEGESDRTLISWQKAHESYFSRLSYENNWEFTETSLVVCERFQVVFKPS